MSIVIDSSVAIKWFVRENLHEQALALLDDRDDLHAPGLIIPEVANIAWKKCIRDEISRQQAEFIVSATQGYIRYLHPSGALSNDALNIALVLNHPVYDCIYLSHANALDSIVVTADLRFVAACKETEYAARLQFLGDLAALPP